MPLRPAALLACCLTLVLPHPAPAQDAQDEAAACAVVQKAVAALEAQDVAALIALYSPSSPFRDARRREATAAFAAVRDVRVTGLAFRRVDVHGDRATIRTHADQQATVRATGTPSPADGPTNKVYELVREGDEWRLWRERSAEDEAVDALVQSTTDAARSAIATDPDLQTPGFVRALNSRGYGLSNQGKFAAARALHETAATIAAKLGDDAGLGLALANTAFSLQCQGEFAQAAETYRRALPPTERSGSAFVRTFLLIAQGELFRLTGDYSAAASNYQKAIADAENSGSAAQARIARNDLGLVYQSSGQYAKACAVFDGLRREALASGDREAEARALNNIGIVHYTYGNLDLALAEYHEAQSLFAALGYQPDVASCLNNIGLVQAARGRYAYAEESYRQVVQIRRELGMTADVPSALDNIGNCLAAQDRYSDALGVYAEGLAACGPDPDLRAHLLTDQSAALYGLKRFEEARAAAAEAAASARRTGNPGLVSVALRALGDAQAGLRQAEAARASYLEAIQESEQARGLAAGAETDREGYFEQFVPAYTAMVGLLAARGDAAGALAYAERARARVLLEVMQGGRLQTAAVLTDQEREAEAKARAAVVAASARLRLADGDGSGDPERAARLRAELQGARLAYAAQETALCAAHPGLRVRRAEVATFSRSDDATLLPNTHTALLSYAVGTDQTVLFVLRRGAGGTVVVTAHVLPVGRRRLADLVRKFRDEVSDPNRAFAAEARQLYRLLVEPAQGSIAGAGTLIVCPDGPLWELPFAAVQPAPGRYLLEDRAIALVPSLTVYREMVVARGRRHERSPERPVLAMGDPDLRGGRALASVLPRRGGVLQRLPDAAAEARGIAALYGPSGAVYTGAAAQEGLLKRTAGSYAVIHLATHGFLDDANPMYSHVVLAEPADGDREDGLLETWEMMDLPLKADLVVLSACQTGRGRVGAGEGLIGMSWALFAAGCPSAVVSQWEVRSDSTKAMMLRFHEALRTYRQARGPAPRLAKALALRQAALKLLRSDATRHPFHWAGFVLVGDPD